MNAIAWLACLAQAAGKLQNPDKIEAMYHITAGGWAVMIFSVGVVTLMTAWCIYKVMATPSTEGHVHSQADIEPPDMREP